MNIAIIGATGFIGKEITEEALNRGHQVTAIARNVESLPKSDRLTAKNVDVTDTAALAEALRGAQVVISAFNPGTDPTGRGFHDILAAVRQAKAPRLLVVGGAGSLEAGSGKRVVDQPDFPAAWKEGALKTAAMLDELRKVQDVDWVFLSPPAMIEPGERTGKYRVGKDTLLTDAQGQSRISVPDYAVAMLDEAEKPQHSRARFTVAY